VKEDRLVGVMDLHENLYGKCILFDDFGNILRREFLLKKISSIPSYTVIDFLGVR
jgi:hypothetical protein